MTIVSKSTVETPDGPIPEHVLDVAADRLAEDMLRARRREAWHVEPTAIGWGLVSPQGELRALAHDRDKLQTAADMLNRRDRVRRKLWMLCTVIIMCLLALYLGWQFAGGF